jgi:hypothetical protein
MLCADTNLHSRNWVIWVVFCKGGVLDRTLSRSDVYVTPEESFAETDRCGWVGWIRQAEALPRSVGGVLALDEVTLNRPASVSRPHRNVGGKVEEGALHR